MAAAQRYRTRLFVAAPDDGEGGYLLFSLDLNRLFSSQEKPQPQADADCPPPPLPLLSLPDPVACFKRIHSNEYMVFSDSPCGDLIAGIGANGRTLLYDGAAFTRGPDMISPKRFVFFLVPVRRRMFFAITAYPEYDSGPQFEALQQQPSPGGSSRWAWSAVPDPPGLACRRAEVKAYFVSGARVWVSVRYQGTYSYHTGRRRWRAEGAWELPIYRRGVLVSDFLGTGRRLLFGFRALDKYDNENPFCAVDMDASPPAVVATWPETYPAKQLWRAGYGTCGQMAQVGYYGGGRFCLWVANHDNSKKQRRSILSFMAVQLSPELLLLERQLTDYMLPISSRYFGADVIM
ncbi:hypothetical protein CFC21_094210 [Triticum aestivum]|uniref:DUF295 domain-containing protein n=2 Tax=Triticum aestivum TaxID=4565 RepID=A0A3B6QM20_WHEAT|nr:hypothetical protein CFC21_094210 [Triticum aestivum]